MVKQPLGWFLLETREGPIPSSLGAPGLYVPYWVSASETPGSLLWPFPGCL